MKIEHMEGCLAWDGDVRVRV